MNPNPNKEWGSKCRYCGSEKSASWLMILDGKPPVCHFCATSYNFTRHELEKAKIEAVEKLLDQMTDDLREWRKDKPGNSIISAWLIMEKHKLLKQKLGNIV